MLGLKKNDLETDPIQNFTVEYCFFLQSIHSFSHKVWIEEKLKNKPIKETEPIKEMCSEFKTQNKTTKGWKLFMYGIFEDLMK